MRSIDSLEISLLLTSLPQHVAALLADRCSIKGDRLIVRCRDSSDALISQTDTRIAIYRAVQKGSFAFTRVSYEWRGDRLEFDLFER